MLSLTREHRFWSSEGLKMEPTSLPKRSCEAKRAAQERTSADDSQIAPEATFVIHPVHFEVPGRILVPGGALPRKSMVSLRRERTSRKAACQTPVTSTSKTSLLVDL